MIANTLPELRGFKSGICDDVAVVLLKWSSTCQIRDSGYVMRDMRCGIRDPGYVIRDLKRASRIPNLASRISPVSRRYPAAESDQNRAERPMPTLVFLIELDSKLSLRLERCTPPNPWMESVRR